MQDGNPETNSEHGNAMAHAVHVQQPHTKPKKSRTGLWLTLILGSFFVLPIFLIALFFLIGNDGGFGEKIGVVEVLGPISESKTIVSQLREFRKDDSIKAIVVRIDSPGGAVAPSQEIFEAVKLAKKEKPLAVSMGGTAASGGYYIAVGSDKIFANPGTVTGSIGVITQLFNVSKVMQKIEVDVHTITTGKSKDMGNMFREFSENDDKAIRKLIDDIYEQFVGHVAEGRHIEVEKVRELADGGVFTGRQALELNLVDELGTLDDAIAWVGKEANLGDEPKIVYPRKPEIGLADLLQGGVHSMLNQVKSATTPVVEYRFVGPQ